MEGPIQTDQEGNLDTKILMCQWGEYKCVHFGVHDHHYFYCAAQDAPNKHSSSGEYAYPWPNAGKQLMDTKPDNGCPFMPDVKTSHDD